MAVVLRSCRPMARAGLVVLLGMFIGLVALAYSNQSLFENDDKTSIHWDQSGITSNTSKQHSGEVLPTSPERRYDPSTTKEICTFQRRALKLQNACENLPKVEKQTFNRTLLVDHENKIIISFMEKAGSTTLKEMLYSLKSRKFLKVPTRDDLVENGYVWFSSFTDTEKEELLRVYTSVVIVRHPYDRLRSAYYDKFVRNPFKIIDSQEYNAAIKKYRKNKKDTSGTMKFDEYINYILDSKPNGHWRPYYIMSWPCYIRYDYILRLETWERDLDFLITNLLHTRAKGLSTHPKHVGQYQKTSRLSLHKFVPEFGQVSDQNMARIEDRYGRDLELFGYSWGRNTTGYCSTRYTGGTCC